jgi:hypothetical protein
MTTTFEKLQYNTNYDHTTPVVKMFNEMGYSNVKVTTSLANGLSHYVKLSVQVLNEGKTYAEMFIYNNITDIEVRISDHLSGLEKNCGGVCRNKMSFQAFNKLRSTGAIALVN